jgi:hypothetical protein
MLSYRDKIQMDILKKWLDLSMETRKAMKDRYIEQQRHRLPERHRLPLDPVERARFLKDES